MCIHLDKIPQSDRQTDGQKWYINIALCICILTRDKTRNTTNNYFRTNFSRSVRLRYLRAYKLIC